MANNLIQIKRSATTATPGSLSAGELAYSNTTQVLYIGSTDGATVVPIAGYRNPGTLTANHALVANSTSAIDSIKTGNLVFTGAAQLINLGGNNGTAGYLLASNGAANAYWLNPATLSTNPAGSNTQVQFDDSGSFGATDGFTFNKVTNNVFIANTLTVGSATVNSTIYTGKAYTANDSSYLNGNTAAQLQTYASNAAANAYSNATSYADTKAATAYSNATSYADTKAATAYSNATSYADTKASAAYTNAMADTLSRSDTYTGNNTFQGTLQSFSSNVTFSGANVLISGTNTNITSNTTVGGTTTTINSNTTINGTTTTIASNVSITSSNINATSATLNIRDIVATGNLTVTGTLVTIDTTNLSVKDNMIILADQQANTDSFSDLVDAGFFVPTGNTTSTFYSGLARIASSSSNTNPYFRLFSSVTNPNNTVIDPAAANTTTGTLQAFLSPWGSGGAFVVNSSAISLTANATVAVSLTANTLTLTSPLNAASGGTGQSSYAVGDLLYASGSTTLSKLGIGSNGDVLQITNNLPAYGSLDGGTF